VRTIANPDPFRIPRRLPLISGGGGDDKSSPLLLNALRYATVSPLSTVRRERTEPVLVQPRQLGGDSPPHGPDAGSGSGAHCPEGRSRRQEEHAGY